MSRIVAYRRVSTARQGASGLGLAAQEQAIADYAASTAATIIAAFTEIESGKRNDRVELAKALREAKATGSTLVIAKLDRLSRNAAFLMTLQESGVRFVAADMPNANSLTVGILALVAQEEAAAISKRTRLALAAAKAKGRRLGNPNGAAALHRAGKGNADAIAARQAKANDHAIGLREIFDEVALPGASLAQIAAALNARGVRASHGGEWHPASVARVRDRLAA